MRARIKSLSAAVRRASAGAVRADPAHEARAAEGITGLRADVKRMAHAVGVLTRDVESLSGRLEQMVASARTEAVARASLAGIVRPRLQSDTLILLGRAVDRARARRITVGEPVTRSLKQFAGVTRCATEADDVRDLWERLLAFEEACGDVLRGHPASVLDIPSATVALAADGRLHVTAGSALAADRRVVAVPKFTYDYPSRKLANFGHWLLDCAPAVFLLSQIAPDATFLLPSPIKTFQESTLALLGVDSRSLVAWDGAPFTGSRVLALENDGRTGGGRPLSPLMEVRRQCAAADRPPKPGRIYVSRRDARGGRQWVTNEAQVEDLFRSRGFEIVTMGDCPLDTQVQMFRGASVVAGVSGSGLTDLVFAAPGIDVIVLASDSLIRWYADETGARSSWASGRRTAAGELAALGDSPRFYAHLTAAFEQRCHSFVGSDRMPLEPLREFVDDVIQTIGGA